MEMICTLKLDVEANSLHACPSECQKCPDVRLSTFISRFSGALNQIFKIL